MKTTLRFPCSLLSFFKQHSRGVAGVLLAVAGALTVQPAGAALLLYEPFPATYLNGTLLGAGTTATVWADGNGTSAGASAVVTNAAELSYSGLADSSGFGIQAAVGASRNRGASITSQASGTVYGSFLLKVLSLPSANKCLVYMRAGTSGGTPTFGVFVNPSGSLVISKKSGTPASSATAALTVGQTYFVVMRYTFIAGSSNDKVELWLNPDNSTFGLDEPNVPASAVSLTTGSDDATIDSFFIAGLVADASIQYLDEVRVGTLWADVTPIGICVPAAVSAGPTNQVASVGGTATFAISATGSLPNYQWQVMAPGSGTWNNVGTSSSSYTTPSLTILDNGSQFQCIVSSPCTNLTSTSTVATVTVTDPSGKLFRSFQNGNWNDTNTWQQSVNGSTWVTATAVPNNTSSNITVQATHTVTMTAPINVDQLTVQANGELDVSGATLEITNSGAAVDGDFFGTLRVLDVAGSTVTQNGALKFEAGSRYSCVLHTATTIPTATWDAASTCAIEPASAGSFVPGGLSQTFGNFVWNWPSQNASAILAGALTNVAGDFELTANSGFCFGKKPDAGTDSLVVTIGGAIKAHAGAGNFLLGSGGTESGTYVIQVGKGVTVDTGAKFDFGNPNATAGNVTLDFTGSGAYTLNGITVGNPNSASYFVADGVTVTLNSPITVGAGRSLTVNGGVLNFNANLVTMNGSLTNFGTLAGAWGTAMTAGTGSIAYGGTLSLSGLPAFVGGESFQFFGAGSYGGSFNSIVPSTPGSGLTWDTSQLGSTGTLVVGGVGAPVYKITSSQLSGTQLTLNGTGGTVSGPFTVVSSPDVTTPIGSWSTLTNGNFDASGNFSVTAIINAGNTQSFFRISHP